MEFDSEILSLPNPEKTLVSPVYVSNLSGFSPNVKIGIEFGDLAIAKIVPITSIKTSAAAIERRTVLTIRCQFFIVLYCILILEKSHHRDIMTTSVSYTF